jgi:hypothetical protein
MRTLLLVGGNMGTRVSALRGRWPAVVTVLEVSLLLALLLIGD